MVQIKTKRNGDVAIKMNGSADAVLSELGAIAAKMNRLSRDLRGIADRLCSDGMRVELPEKRTKTSRADG